MGGVAMHEATRRRLHELAACGSLPLSAFGRAVREDLQSLFAGGIISIVRSGSGEAVQVQNQTALDHFIVTHFPECVTAGDLPARAKAVRGMRNSKQARGQGAALLLLRALRPVDCRLDGLPCNLLALTRSCGAAALVIHPGKPLVMSGTLALIENQECFLHAERMNIDVDAVLYTAGRLAGVILDALAGEGMRDCRYLHCPDYDPVGLGEYLRYKTVLGDRLSLYSPPDLRELLRTYGKPSLLQGRNGVLMQVLRRTAPPELHRILTWMDEANAGLEQEILIGGDTHGKR